jgi:hypothetical protein
MDFEKLRQRRRTLSHFIEETYNQAQVSAGAVITSLLSPALRRQSHSSEIASAREFLFMMQDDVPSAQLDRSSDILIRAGLSRARDLRARGASWPDFDQKPRGSAWTDAIDRKSLHSTLSRSGMPR